MNNRIFGTTLEPIIKAKQTTPATPRYTSTEASFFVADKDGDWFGNCLVEKSKFGDQLLKLNFGDKIRISGRAAKFLRYGSNSTFESWFRIDSIQVIK